MRSNIAISILILILAAFSIGGGTVAWFVTETDPLSSTFSAGTVRLSEPDFGGLVAAGSCDTIFPEGITGTRYTSTWTLQSTGSKQSYIRVRPNFEFFIENETITELSGWFEGEEIVPGMWHGQYFEYIKGSHDINNPLRKPMNEGGGTPPNEVGVGDIWDDGNIFYLHYQMHDGYIIDETQLYIGLAVPTSRVVGHFPWSYTFPPAVTEFWFETDYIYTEQGGTEVDFDSVPDGTTIYIASHIRCYQVSQIITWSVLDAAGNWVEGSDGWWYYGTESGPIPVLPGEEVSVTFAFCIANNFEGTITISLEAEAIQSSHNAIDYTWTSNPWYTPPAIPSLSLTKVADRTTVIAGEMINYTINVTNDGAFTLSNIQVIDEMLGINTTIASLAPGAASTFSEAYTVDESYPLGPLVNSATARTTFEGRAVSANASATVTIGAVAPSLGVTKVADRTTATLGNIVNYTINVTTDGNVTLTDILVVDEMLGISTIIDSLAPGASYTITGPYTVTESDLPGPLENTVTAAAVYNGEPVGDSSSASVTLVSTFADLNIGAYVSIPNNNGVRVTFQKIGTNWVLLRGTSGTGNRDNAITQGTGYHTIFQNVASSSRLLTEPEARQLDQSTILALGSDWWTSSRQGTTGNAYWYVANNGSLATRNSNNTIGVRPSMLLAFDLLITDGEGTQASPYILVLP